MEKTTLGVSVWKCDCALWKKIIIKAYTREKASAEIWREGYEKLARTFDWKNQHFCSSFELMHLTVAGQEECDMSSTGMQCSHHY